MTEFLLNNFTYEYDVKLKKDEKYKILIRGSNFIIIPSDLSTKNINKIIDVLYLDKISVKQRYFQTVK